MYTIPETQMDIWEQICKAFAKRYNAKLLFVNDCSCGIMYDNGSFAHVYVDEMIEILKKEKNK